jgi:cytidylate kinase
MSSLTIAIDGPSGAGKGTVARGVARALGYRHLDTGAMYRAVGWLALQQGTSLDDEDALAELARTARFGFDGGRVVVNGSDITTAIRTAEMDRAATSVARLLRVRKMLVDQQRRMGAGGGVVVEGRDIGTVVFPNAELKIYLDASPEERARRRANDPAHAAGSSGVASVAGALAERDRSDQTRAVSPLKIAPDAVVLDTTGLSVEQVVVKALALVEERLAQRTSGG